MAKFRDINTRTASVKRDLAEVDRGIKGWKNDLAEYADEHDWVKTADERLAGLATRRVKLTEDLASLKEEMSAHMSDWGDYEDFDFSGAEELYSDSD